MEKITTALNHFWQFTCPHSCVLDSFQHVCRQEQIPICQFHLIMKAAYSAGHSAPYPVHELSECKNTLQLLIRSKFLNHVESIHSCNIQNLRMLNEVLTRVTQRIESNFGLLGFDYHDCSIGHVVCFEKLRNHEHLQIWDAQKKDLWSEDDCSVSNIKAVHSFEVNNEHVKSLSATCSCLANIIQPMEISDGTPESNIVPRDHNHTGSRSYWIKERSQPHLITRLDLKWIKRQRSSYRIIKRSLSSDRIKIARSKVIKTARERRSEIWQDGTIYEL